jgi:hypothetical protein
MFVLSRSFLLAFFICSSSPAVAGSTISTIKRITLYEQGDLVYVFPEGGVKEPPACHGSNGDYVSFKLSRPRAAQYLELLTTAMVEQKTVMMSTAGDCIDQPTSDTLRYFSVLDVPPLVTGPQQGESTGGKIVHVSSVGDETLTFRIAGNTQSNRPACATSGRFAVSKNSAHASVVLTAFSTSRTLANVRGTGLCRLWGNSEDVRWIEVCPLTGC